MAKQENNNSDPSAMFLPEARAYLRRLFNIEAGTDEANTIEGIKNGVEFKGINLWILICSIFIASVGLNTNSTAVIIGAMLVSPLMGPILGIGLAIGIFDFVLLKKSLKNFATAVFFSVLTSTLYFSITPLSEVQSELLARTTPTIFDVFIAFFGGLAGIVAGSRKQNSNVIPGVAIATALMPPLCTAGFGLATGNMSYFFGAFYLFFINSVFIGFATLLIVRYLKFKPVGFVQTAMAKKARNYVSIFVIITMIPSIWIAYNVVQESFFKNRALSFIQDYVESPDRQVIRTDLEYKSDSSVIEIALLGKPMDLQEQLQLREKMRQRPRLEHTKLIIHQAGSMDGELMMQLNNNLKSGIIEDLYKKNEADLSRKNLTIESLQAQFSAVYLDASGNTTLMEEIRLQYPQIEKVALVKLAETNIGIKKTDTLPTVFVEVKPKTSAAELEKFRKWLEIRLDQDSLRLIRY